MGQFIFKTILSAMIIAGVSELSKRSLWLSSLLMALPLMSLIALVVMERSGASNESLIQWSYGVFWLVIPSLLFFLALPFFLKKGMTFYVAFSMAIVVTFIFYIGYDKAMKFFKIY